MKKIRGLIYSLLAVPCGFILILVVLTWVTEVLRWVNINTIGEIFVLFQLFSMVAIIPANIAYNKGRNFAAWYVYATCLFPVTFVHSLCIRDNDKAKQEKGWVRCPYCGEYNKPEAMACHYCYRELHLGNDQ